MRLFLLDDNRLIKTTTRAEGDRLVLVVEGAAESDSQEKLTAALEDADRQAKATNAQRVVADIRALEFCTSSCLKIFATWVVEMPTPSPYKIVFLSNPEHSWQRRSLKALTLCAPEIASVEESSTA